MYIVLFDVLNFITMTFNNTMNIIYVNVIDIL